MQQAIGNCKRAPKSNAPHRGATACAPSGRLISAVGERSETHGYQRAPYAVRHRRAKRAAYRNAIAAPNVELPPLKIDAIFRV